uniref:BLVR domain-containing protein n=1 Tax=Strongyloides stercoralis TaxID=6248 RepID=A0A0K0DSP8_STRER
MNAKESIRKENHSFPDVNRSEEKTGNFQKFGTFSTNKEGHNSFLNENKAKSLISETQNLHLKNDTKVGEGQERTSKLLQMLRQQGLKRNQRIGRQKVTNTVNVAPNPSPIKNEAHSLPDEIFEEQKSLTISKYEIIPGRRVSMALVPDII